MTSLGSEITVIRDNQTTDITVTLSDTDAEFFTQAAAGYATKALQYRNQAETFATSAQTNANIAGDEATAAQQSALNASASAQDAATSATNAGTSETNAGNSEANALSYANSAQQYMQSASNFRNSAALSASQARGYATQAQGYAESAEQSAQTASAKVAEVTAEGTRQIGLLSAEGTAQVSAVQSAGSTRVTEVESAIEAKGAETLASIPDDYTSLSTQITNVSNDVTDLKSDLNAVEHNIYEFTPAWDNVTLSVQTNGRYDTSGVFHSDSNRRYAIVQPVTTGEHYRLSTVVSSALIPAILFYNGDTFLSYLKTGSGTQEIVTNYEFTIPANATKLIVQNSTGSAGEFKLEQETVDKELDVYHKAEVDHLIGTSQKKYGMRYSLTDATDEGERVFDAVGLSATIGIGATNGASDFDNIYPWSGMKRCNIKRNAAGAQIITYEGETGFALDGTNGDVFVYIPKFGYERYQENGYEYHVITAPSTTVPLHPAFIDGEKILDGIYIGAYEGTDSESTLHSVSGSIPTNNITPATILSYAQANGTNYSLYGIKEVSAVWALMAVEYGKRNSNRILGYGASDFEQPSEAVARDKIVLAGSGLNTVRTSKWSASHKGYMPVGSNITICDTTQSNVIKQGKLTGCTDSGDYTDWTFDGLPVDVTTDCFIGSAPFTTGFCDSAPTGALNWHTGRTDWISGSNVRNPVRYRWIENVVGNVWHFLPDITFNNCQMYICDTIAKYGFGKTNDGYVPKSDTFTTQTSNGSKADNTGINYWIDKLNIDPFAKAIPMGRSWDMSLTSALAFGAYYYMRTGLNVVCNGGGFDHLYRSNVLTNRAWDGTSIKWFLYGGRLIYKPVV